MNALAGRGDNGMNDVRAMVVNGVLVEMSGAGVGEIAANNYGSDVGTGADGRAGRMMRLVDGGAVGLMPVGTGVQGDATSAAEAAEAAAVNTERAMQTWRTWIDGTTGPVDEARSLASFARVMHRLKQQQEQQEQRWRWVRRMARALAALAGMGAVRMLSR